MPWFARKADLPIPPPEPPPSAAARKAKEQGWLDSIRARSGTAGGRGKHAAGGVKGVQEAEGGGTIKGSPGPQGRKGPKGHGWLGEHGSSTTPPTSPTSSRRSPFSRPSADVPRPMDQLPKRSNVSEFGGYLCSDSGGRPYGRPATPTMARSRDRTFETADQLAMQTKTLAHRLQELATAHEDGLLTDEEYRILRLGVFTTSASHGDSLLSPDPARSTARLSPNVGGIYPPASPHLASTDNLHTPKPSRPTSLRPSLRSTRSTASFFSNIFRRGSKINLAEDSQWEDGAPPSSPERGSAYPDRAPSALSIRTNKSYGSSRSAATTRRSGRRHLAPFTPPMPDRPFSSVTQSDISCDSSSDAWHSPSLDSPSARTRSIRLRPELHPNFSSARSTRSSKSSGPPGSSSASMFSSYTDGSRSIARSSNPQTSVYSRSSRINDSTEFPAQTRDYEPSAAELRREISDLEYECSRLLETFREMERSVIAKYRSGPASSEAAAALGFASAELGLPRGLEADRDPNVPVRGRPISFLAPLPTAATLRARSANGGTLRKSKRRGPNFGQRSIRPSENDMPSTPPSVHSSPASVSSPRLAASAALEGDAEQEEALRTEVEGILGRRQAVEEKYEKRLEYLRAKLKGAMIRERLPR